jgi:2-methylisocitrate lyase-like PEP mutase family enzyme
MAEELQRTSFVPAVQKLRDLLAEKGRLIVCPGVYDGFTARIALREGIDCLYMVCMISTIALNIYGLLALHLLASVMERYT